MRRTTRVLTAAACAVFLALGAASAGERRMTPPFRCSEAQAAKRTLYWDVDQDGKPYRIASFDQVTRFSGVVRLPMDDIGPTFREIDPAARFVFFLGDVQYSGRLSDSNYRQGRPSATFDIVPGDYDPDTNTTGPAYVKARVSWSRTHVTVAVTARQPLLLTDPGLSNVSVDDQKPMSVAFYGVQADLDVHFKGTVRNRTVVDGFDVSIPLTTVKLRGTGVAQTQ